MPSDLTVGNLIVNVMTKLNDFKAGMDDVGGKFDTVKQKVNDNKAAIKGASLAIAGAAVAAGVALGAIVLKTATYGDTFNKMSLRTGETAATLTALSYAADISGTSIGTIEKAIKRAAANMYDAANGTGEAKEAFEALGITVTDKDGNLKKGSDLLLEFADATKDMEDASAKAALAQEIFGRAGTELLPFFADGSAGIKELTDNAEKYGIVLDDVQAKSGADMIDAMTNMKAAFSGIGLAIGNTVLPVVTPLVNGIADLTSNVGGFLLEHETLTKGLLAAGAAVAILAGGIAGLTLVGFGLPALIAGFTALAPLLAIGAPILIGIAAVATAIALLVTHINEAKAAATALWEIGIEPTIDLIKGGFDSVWETVKEKFGWVWDKVNGIFADITLVLTPLIDLFIGGFSSVWDTVKESFDFIWDKVELVIGNIYSKFRWFLDKLGIELPEMEDLWDDIGTAGEGAADGIGSKWDEMKASYAKNMEANKTKHKETVDAIDKKEAVSTASQKTELTKRKDDAIEKEEEKLAALKEKEEEAIANSLQSYEDSIIDKEFADKDFLFDLEMRYGDSLTEQERLHALSLQNNGIAYQAYLDNIMEVTPAAWETIFEGVGTKFDERIASMGDAWMEDIHHGNFKNSIDFIGEYLKQTFEAAFVDIGGNILQSLVDRIKTGITNSLVGVGESLLGGGGGTGGLIASAVGSAAGIGGSLIAGAGAVAAVAVPALVVAGIGFGVYKAAEAILATTGLSDAHTSQASRSRKQAKTSSYIAARYAGFGAANIGTGWTTMTNADMQAAKYGQIAIDAGENVEYEAGRQGDLVYARSIAEGQLEKYAAAHRENVKNALLLYASGDLAIWHDEGKFHYGGIIPGIIGQEKRITALAGEEVLTRSDPRHSTNVGQGMIINMNFAGINSLLDAKTVGKVAGDEILKQLKYQTKFTR